ncbi:MAG: endo-1,4-beta-xylanase [Coleofasciculus sp. G3-WIS-01]|uniref:endo-1,4-beta-xylanase n=1 Tax=Coleofasciculus sp. G3-WIS-01 TaxID=3069528 RepID=UPI0032F1B01E
MARPLLNVYLDKNSPTLPLAKTVSDFAIANGKKLRGNHLFNSLTIGKTEQYKKVSEILKEFPEIKYWDCCLELIGDSGRFRNSIIQSEIDRCFLVAKTQLPDATFFYCDYYRDSRKWQKTYELIDSLLSKDIPLGGLSIQLHSNLRPPIAKDCLTLDWQVHKIWMNRIKTDFGLLIHVPEIVCWQPATKLTFKEVKSLNKNSNIRRELLRTGAGFFLDRFWDVEDLQLKAYSTLIDSCQGLADMVGFWSAFDASPWNWFGNRAKAGFWDENFIPKPAAKVLFYL